MFCSALVPPDTRVCLRSRAEAAASPSAGSTSRPGRRARSPAPQRRDTRPHQQPAGVSSPRREEARFQWKMSLFPLSEQLSGQQVPQGWRCPGTAAGASTDCGCFPGSRPRALGDDGAALPTSCAHPSFVLLVTHPVCLLTRVARSGAWLKYCILKQARKFFSFLSCRIYHKANGFSWWL